ncbi:hypothetical protein LTR97_007466 [Elasticomyces elasticus]|uniref:Uncharacterized protein n=1 Tax=Elasticomyces elasticus TaxID=574655 RepID=A0AAN8A253_9PEZI|nr:hypothetical protein LTR97_007466 [Elasticomyces elasticus]
MLWSNIADFHQRLHQRSVLSFLKTNHTLSYIYNNITTPSHPPFKMYSNDPHFQHFIQTYSRPTSPSSPSTKQAIRPGMIFHMSRHAKIDRRNQTWVTRGAGDHYVLVFAVSNDQQTVYVLQMTGFTAHQGSLEKKFPDRHTQEQMQRVYIPIQQEDTTYPAGRTVLQMEDGKQMGKASYFNTAYWHQMPASELSSPRGAIKCLTKSSLKQVHNIIATWIQGAPIPNGWAVKQSTPMDREQPWTKEELGIDDASAGIFATAQTTHMGAAAKVYNQMPMATPMVTSGYVSNNMPAFIPNTYVPNNMGCYQQPQAFIPVNMGYYQPAIQYSQPFYRGYQQPYGGQTMSYAQVAAAY